MKKIIIFIFIYTFIITNELFAHLEAEENKIYFNWGIGLHYEPSLLLSTSRNYSFQNKTYDLENEMFFVNKYKISWSLRMTHEDKSTLTGSLGFGQLNSNASKSYHFGSLLINENDELKNINSSYTVESNFNALFFESSLSAKFSNGIGLTCSSLITNMSNSLKYYLDVNPEYFENIDNITIEKNKILLEDISNDNFLVVLINMGTFYKLSMEEIFNSNVTELTPEEQNKPSQFFSVGLYYSFGIFSFEKQKDYFLNGLTLSFSYYFNIIDA